MKDFKRLIKEAYLGNPLNEDYNRMHNVELNAIYKDKLGVKDTKGLTRDDLIRGLKFHDASMDEYGKPFLELSIAQKQELLSYMNRETEKQFQTDYERRRRGDYSDDMEDGMTDYQRRRMDEELKLGVKYELPTGETGYIMTGGSKDPKDWKFSANKESYLSVKDKLKPTKKQPGKYDGAYDMGMGKGHHIDEGTCGYGEEGKIDPESTSKLNPAKSEMSDKEIDAEVRRLLKRNFMEENMNDPVLVKARAAKMADEKEKAKQAALNKKYGSSFMDKLDAEIDLKQELQDLKNERAQLMIDMEQEAEPEGGEIADLYGMKLNRIDLRTAEIRDELEDLRIYESVNEDDELNVNVDNANDNYAKAIEKESDSAAYESLQESLKKKLQDRLK